MEKIPVSDQRKEKTDYYSYIATFQTTSDWQTIALEMHQMYPAYRGRTLQHGQFDTQ